MDNIGFHQVFEIIEKVGVLVSLVLNVWFLWEKVRLFLKNRAKT